MIDKNYKYSKETGIIIGLALEVHKYLGCGFQELIYQRALAMEFRNKQVSHEMEFVMAVIYKGVQIGTRRVDFLVDKKIAVELKAKMNLEPAHYAQALNYLEIYKLEVGLLINFGKASLEVKRLINKKLSDPNYL